METVFIYGHRRLSEFEIRYIGKAKNPKRRLQGHLLAAKKGVKTYHANWIRSLLAKGEIPVLEILDEVPESQWKFWERAYIKHYRDLGYALTNGTEGGDGGDTWTGSSDYEGRRKRMSEAQKGKIISEEQKLKLSLAHRGRKLTEEACKKMSDSWTPERKAALAAKNAARKGQAPWNKGKPSPYKGIPRSEEVKEKIRAGNTGLKRSLETCAAISEAQKGKAPWNKGKKLPPLSPNWKEKLSVAHKGKPWSDARRAAQNKEGKI